MSVSLETATLIKDGAIEVVMAGLDPGPEAVARLADWLCDAERQRAARFRRACHRRRFVVARARLRQLLGQRLDVRPDSIEFTYGANGKPALGGRFAASGWRFNLAHCDDVAV